MALFDCVILQDLRNTEGRHQTVEEAIRRLSSRQEELGNVQMDTLMNAVDEKYRELFKKVPFVRLIIHISDVVRFLLFLNFYLKSEEAFLSMKDELETGISAKLMSLAEISDFGSHTATAVMPVSPVSAMGPRQVVVLGASLTYPVLASPDRGNLF